MLEAFLTILAREIRDNKRKYKPLIAHSPVAKFLSVDQPDVELYLRLDDSKIWSLLDLFRESTHNQLGILADRIMNRKIYKCVDIGKLYGGSHGDKPNKIAYHIREGLEALNLEDGYSFLEDRPDLTGYKEYQWGDGDALMKVLYRDEERNENIDVGRQSEIIQALAKRRFHRIYVPDDESRERIIRLCRKN
jgi:hypothetical protein